MRLLRKSKEEVQWERKAHLREAKDRLNRYAGKCQEVLARYKEQAVEARRLDNDALVKRFAAKMVALEKQVKRAKTLQLVISDIELSKEQVGLFKSLTDTMKDFAKALSEDEVTARTAAEIDRDLTAASARAEQVDVLLGEVLDHINDKISTSGEATEAEIEGTLARIETAAVDAERKSIPAEKTETTTRDSDRGGSAAKDELDSRIEDGLRKVREAKRD